MSRPENGEERISCLLDDAGSIFYTTLWLLLAIGMGILVGALL